MNNISIIADSSVLFSLIVKTDKNHRLAKKIAKNLLKQKGSILIPGDVFSEVVNTIGKKINHETAVISGHTLLQEEVFNICEANQSLRASSFEKFKKQPSSVSFTDCLVMAFADEYQAKEIFGFDESFKKNGYNRLGIDRI